MSKEKYNGETTLAKLIRNIGTWLNDKVSKSTAINGKALNTNIELTAEDVGAIAGTSTLLWSGSIKTGTITLTNSYKDFKMLFCEAKRGDFYAQTPLYTDFIVFNNKYTITARAGTLGAIFVDETNITLSQGDYTDVSLEKIYGIK